MNVIIRFKEVKILNCDSVESVKEMFKEYLTDEKLMEIDSIFEETD